MGGKREEGEREEEDEHGTIQRFAASIVRSSVSGFPFLFFLAFGLGVPTTRMECTALHYSPGILTFESSIDNLCLTSRFCRVSKWSVLGGLIGRNGG